MSESRKKNTLRNIVIALFSNVLIYVLSLFTSKVIKDHLGLQVIGLNGVMSNVISVLGLTEMGIGSAITFALYKPLAEGNTELIKSIMSFFKKAYRIIAVVVLVIGLAFLPLIPFINKDNSFSRSYVYLVYSLFLFNSVVSYLLVYKRTLIVADQKNYVVTIVSLVYTYVLRISQVCIVFFTSNYILYLICQIICTLIYNLSICFICNKYYPYLKEKTNKLPKDVYNTIISKIKALFYHSIGTVVVLGTDNILISYFCGLEEAGRYNLYYSIITMISTFVVLVFDNMRDSIGNFLVTESNSNKKLLFDRLFFLNQSIVSICSICLLVLLTPFISCLYGKDSLLSSSTIIAMVAVFYVGRNNMVASDVKSAAGLFEQDKYVPLIEGVINIVSSIFFAKMFGLIGIVLGTLVSSILCPVIVAPYIVYRFVFFENVLDYFRKYFAYLLRAGVICFVIYYFINNYFSYQPTSLFYFFIEALVVFLITSIIWIISVCYKEEFKYFAKLILCRIKRMK